MSLQESQENPFQKQNDAEGLALKLYPVDMVKGEEFHLQLVDEVDINAEKRSIFIKGYNHNTAELERMRCELRTANTIVKMWEDRAMGVIR